MINYSLAALITKELPKVIEATPAAIQKLTKNNIIATPSAGLGDFLGSLPFYAVNLFFFFYLVFLWFLMVKWVGRDCQSRAVSGSKKIYYQILVLVFNFPGLLLYFLLRPSLTAGEAKRVEMEEEILRLELEKLRREAGEIKNL